MSVSTEVQRTLVKSPPELWAELSSLEGLTRHLGELGEIRITAVEPERKVEWETEDASGVVQLKQSGWGTKVVLTVTRQTGRAPEDEPEADASIELEPQTPVQPTTDAQEPVADAEESETDARPEQITEPEPQIETEATQIEPEKGVPAAEQTAIQEPEQAPESEPETVPSLTQESSEPRRGFWARLFRRRAKAVQATDPEPAQEPELQSAQAVQSQPAQTDEPDPPLQPAPDSTGLELERDSHEANGESEGEAVTDASAPEHAQPSEIPASTPAEEAPDITAELARAEELLAEQTTAMLSAILDRLGAAHHRPFSRG